MCSIFLHQMGDSTVFHTDDRHQSHADLYWWTGPLRKDRKTLDRLTTDFQLLTTDNQRLTAYETYASLYSNRRVDPGAPMLASYEAQWTIDRGKYSRCPYNLMKVVIDEATSRITKTHPHAKFLTHGGNREAQFKAEHMERWNDAQVAILRQEEKFDLVIKDACQYGLGALKHMKAYREDRPESIRVYPGNLFVDLEETLFEKPRRLHHRRFVSKTVLKAMFPKFKREIDDSDHVSDAANYVSSYGHYLGSQDMIELVESWHLPSFLEKGKSPDGRRFLWIQGAILQSDEYNRRSFPFSFFNWKTDPHNTFYGVGLGEDLLGVHIDANVTIRRINVAIEFMPNPYVLTKKGSKVSKASIQNAPATILEYAGNEPPQFILPQTVPGDLLQYIREHEARAYRIAGLSSTAATGDSVPAGLETGRAVESFFAVESVPFNEQLRKFENLVQHVAENNIAVGREIYEQNKNYSVVLPGKRNTITELKWKDVSLDIVDEAYVIRVAPTSALSELPSARLAEVERMVALGAISDPGVIRDLINIPDLEHEDDLITAGKHNIDRMIMRAVDENLFTPPSPNMELQLFIIRATAEEQKGTDYGIVPEENLATLRRMIRRAQELIQRQQIAAQAQAQQQVTPAIPAQQPETGVQPTAITG